MAPEWLVFKAAIAKHFAWAVPTDEAVAIIRKHVNSIVEVGAGSGYWTWLMRQAGITVAAFDLSPPTFTWSDVRRGDERVVRDHPEKALFLCWPPWATGMASGALSAYEGDHIVYVGEWMGGSADPYFFALLVSCFECIELGRDSAVVHARRPADGVPQATQLLPVARKVPIFDYSAALVDAWRPKTATAGLGAERPRSAGCPIAGMTNAPVGAAQYPLPTSSA